MTKHTSFSSANGTTEERRQDRTGRPPIEKSNAPTWTPEEMRVAIDDFLARNASVGMERMSDWDYFWWDLKVTVRHWFGVHTLMASETWEMTPERRLYIAHTGWKCWKCDYREP